MPSTPMSWYICWNSLAKTFQSVDCKGTSLRAVIRQPSLKQLKDQKAGTGTAFNPIEVANTKELLQNLLAKMG
jgi:hypothetical protein